LNSALGTEADGAIPRRVPKLTVKTAQRRVSRVQAVDVGRGGYEAQPRLWYFKASSPACGGPEMGVADVELYEAIKDLVNQGVLVKGTVA
jgi:hypothetical protein